MFIGISSCQLSAKGGGFENIAVIGDSWAYYFTAPSLSLTFGEGNYYYRTIADNTQDGGVLLGSVGSALFGVGAGTLQTRAPLITAAMSGIDTALIVIGANDNLATTDINEYRAAFVEVMDTFEAEGWRLIIGGPQPGYASTPLDGTETATWLERRAWVEAYCDGMGYDYIPMTSLQTSADVCSIAAGYQANTLHLNQAGMNLLAGLYDAKLRAAPLDKNTPFRQAIRNLPNRELLTAAEIADIKLLFEGIGDEVSNLTALYFPTSDMSAGGNAATNLIAPHTAGTYVGTVTYDGGMKFATGAHFDTGIELATKQGLGGKHLFDVTPAYSGSNVSFNIAGVNVVSGNYTTGIRYRFTSSLTTGRLQSSAFYNSPLSVNSDTLTAYTGKVLQHRWDTGGTSTPSTTITNVVAVDGAELAGIPANPWLATMSGTICFNTHKNITATLQATWPCMYIENGDADLQVLADAINAL